MAFCSNCGAELPDGAGFCGNCGAPVGAPQQAADQENGQEIQEAYVPQAPQAYRAPRAPRAPRNTAPAPKNQKSLKITSIIFAIAFLFFFIGLGGRIYTGRVVGKQVTALNDEIEKQAVQLESRGWDADSIKQLRDSKISGDMKGAMIEALAAYARGDAKALYSADLKAYRASNPNYKDDEVYQTAVKTPPTKKTVENLKKTIRENTKGAHDKYGFCWTMLTLGAHYSFFMWFGGVVMALSLGAWILMGGRFNNILQTTVWPVLALAFVLALTFMILYLALDANMEDLMKTLFSNQFGRL